MFFTVDGRKVYAATGGRPFDPKLPCVVFVHGAAGDHTVWALQTRWFAYHGRSVLAIDLPGNGRSEGEMPASVPELGQWLIRFLDAAGLEKAALVGHSLGSLVTLEAASRAPDRIWALALLGSALPMKVNDELLELSRAGDHKAYELMNDWSHSRKTHIGGARMPGLNIIGGSMRLTEQSRAGALYAAFSAVNSYPEAAGFAAAAKVTCPVLLLIGERDMMTPPRAARVLAGKFAACETVTLAECGHSMMAERPDETLDALREVV
jgi:pimeloyl-ACP methyl ester carboxylesterase